MERGEPMRKTMHPESSMMTHGYQPEWSEGALKCPIFQTSTFVFKNAKSGQSFFELAYGLRSKKSKESPGLIYSRINNPDLEILESRLCLWDEADSAAVFSSGMAAITTTVFELCSPGDIILYSEPLYGGTAHFFEKILPRFSIRPISFPAALGPASAIERLNRAGGKKKLSMIFVETPANPTNDLVDIAACSKFAAECSSSKRKVVVAVDNTFMGPLWQKPLSLGADLVLYSATKFLGGHSDLIAGVCLGKKDLLERVRTLRAFLGCMADAWTGWLLLRSLETLKIRMSEQAQNASRIAERLLKYPQIERVYYPSLLPADTPQGRLYASQCLGPGSMISFDIRGGRKQAFKFLDALKLIKLAVSLGGTESLAQHPATMTHVDLGPKLRRRLGIGENMIRLSVGVENYSDILKDIEAALRAF